MTSEIIDKLIAEFSDAARKHHDSTLEGNSRKINKQAKKMADAFSEIVRHGHRGREALLSLVDDENLAVAQMAATFSLKYAPERCIEVLTKLAKDPGIIGFGASQALLRWEEGSWKIE